MRPMHRVTSYVIAVLLAVILTVLPAAMWPDMFMPMADNWENWYWKGQPHPRPSFSLQDPPALFAAEVRLYKILVTPGAYTSRAFTGSPTGYASFFIKPYGEVAGVPPLAMALEHARWSFPVWLIPLLVVIEAWRFVRRRRTGLTRSR
jgi:hypothetical protein